MVKPTVAIVRYEKPLESLRKAIDLSRGLDQMPNKARVFIKPNFTIWRGIDPTLLPKWGVLTTSRVVEDIILILKERGADEIIIGEGPIIYDPKNKELAYHCFKSVGYDVLEKRYGVKCINILDRPFEKVELDAGLVLNFNTDILHSNFVVNIPVLKTHLQTVVSLGIKNFKGIIDVDSRKKCHSVDPEKDLNYNVAKIPNKLPSIFTILDGIYTNEGGPFFNGRIRRSNILIASADFLSADMVGAKVLGYEPKQVPHLVHAAKDQRRPTDLSDIKVVGEKIEAVASFHEHSIPYNEDGTLPMVMEKKGIKGLSYRKYDLTLCTACAGLYPVISFAIEQAWQGNPWEDIEILTGKIMRPTAGKKKTILLGKCIYQLNKENPDIQEMIAVKGCPPSLKDVTEAFHKAGIMLDPAILEDKHKFPEIFMRKFKEESGFEDSFFRVD
jgi:uncharacterized protein (DUF362 family)